MKDSINRLNMNKFTGTSRQWLARCVITGVLAASTLAFAQQAPPPPVDAQQPDPQQQNNGATNEGWPSASAPQQPPASSNGNGAQPAYGQPQPYGQPPYGQPANAPYGGPGYGAPGSYGNNQNPYGQGPNGQGQAPNGPVPYNQSGQQPYGQQPYGQQPYGQQPTYNQQPPYSQQPYSQQAPPQGVPPQLTLAPGSYVTVRLNQQLSSNRNRNGDSFTATLAEPVVVNGVVVAEPGQTVGGVVADSERNNPAKLVVQLTELSLVDGQRLPIETKLVARRGPGFTGQDAGTIIGTTAIGAGIGAAADWGTGAAVGAGVGAVVGALITHNHPSVLYPEQVLTFRIDAPANFSTENAPQAFRYIQPGEYDRAPYQGQGPQVRTAPVAYYGAYGYPYGVGYPYYGYPYSYWGPSVGFYFGSHSYYGRPYYGGRYYYGGRGYRR